MFRFAAAHSAPSTLTQTVIRLGAVAVACSALTWSLSGCGGGSRAKDYVPDSVVSFGDENSAMEDSPPSTSLDPAGSTGKSVKGLVYTVNAVVNESLLTVYTYCTDSTATMWCNGPVGPTPPATAATPILSSTVGSFTTGGAAHAYYFDGAGGINTGNTSNVVTYVDVGSGVVNSVAAPTLKRTYNVIYACATSRLWNQVVAHAFSKGFNSQCDLDWDGAITYASYGARVTTGSTTSLQSQVAASKARGELHDGVLVTVMIGQNDILELYRQVQANSKSDSAAQQDLANLGAVAANIVKDILSTGAKVVLSLTPDLGQSPKATLTNENASLLSQYTIKFNNALKFGMGSTAAQDGRHFALVESDLFTNPITRSASYVHSTAVCAQTGTARPSNSTTVTVTRPDGTTVTANSTPATDDGQVKFCTGATLIDGGSTSTYIWADNFHFAPAGHGLIGSLAASRAFNQF